MGAAQRSASRAPLKPKPLETTMYPDSAAPYLSQGERLASLPISPLVEIREDEPLCVTVSRPPNGFVMPSRASIREHDARLAARDHCAPPAPLDDGDEEQDEEQDLREQVAFKRRDSMREASFRLPSQGSRADIREAFRSMNMSWQD